MKQDKGKKTEMINFIFICLRILGLIMFNSFDGGLKAWRGIIIIELPDEGLIFVGPILITISLTITKGKRLTRLYMKS